MSAEAKGAYIDMLAYAWDNGPIPDDLEALAMAASLTPAVMRRIWPKVAGKWVLIDGGFINLRLEQQRADLEAFMQKQSERGTSGASARWHKHGASNAQVMPKHAPSTAKPMLADGSAVCSLQVDQDQELRGAESAAPSSPVELEYPTVGKVKTWGLTRRQINGWCDQYAGLDIMGECKKALAWCEANPSGRKTPNGMPRFLVSWLNRAADRPKEPQRGTSVPDVAATRQMFRDAGLLS